MLNGYRFHLQRSTLVKNGDIDHIGAEILILIIQETSLHLDDELRRRLYQKLNQKEKGGLSGDDINRACDLLMAHAVCDVAGLPRVGVFET